MGVKTSRLYDTLHDNRRAHNDIRSNEGSYLAAMANLRFYGLRSGIHIDSDSVQRLLERNSPRAEYDHSLKDKAHRGTVSSHPGAHHGEENRNSEGQHRAEHR